MRSESEDRMTMNTYTCYDDDLKVNKTITQVESLNITLKDNCDVLNPQIIINKSIGDIHFNYVELPALTRFYFVKDIIALTADTTQLNLAVDVLYSYREAIGNLQALVTRQENVYNNYYKDERLPSYQNRIQDIRVVEGLQQFDTGHSFFLTVAGANK